MHVLVTGGAGFIGSTTAAALLAAGHEVSIIDDLRRGRREAVPEGARLIVQDIADTTALDRTLTALRPDACFHLAALIEVGESMQQPGRYFAINTSATAGLLDALVRHDVGRVVFSSTAAVYGEPDEVPIVESHPTVPTSPYGESKLMAERLLHWYGQAHGLRSVALRYFNAAGAVGIHGERSDAQQTHLIPLVLAAAAGLRPDVHLFGTDYATPDGTAVRDYLHVADIARAHLLALAAFDRDGALDAPDAPSTDTFLCANLGNGQGFSVREVIRTVEQVTGRRVPVRVGPRRAGDPAVLVASAATARAKLGWIPQHPTLETIVSDAWDHLLATAT
jgi:UDP-glucose 4-epimerase